MRKLSSSLTFFEKFIFPIIPIVVVIIGAYIIANSSEKSLFEYLFVFAWIIILIVHPIVWGTAKKVILSDSKLIISDYFKTDTVDISEVKSVSASYLIIPELIWIQFHNETLFGKNIKFIPPYRAFPVYENKMAQELKELARKRKAELNP
jgi:hypothetical protein